MHLVYGVCLKYLKNRSDAQDAVIEIFEKLSVDIDKFDIDKEFRTWLYVVTKNFCLMKLRHDGSVNRAFEKTSLNFMENDTFVHPIDEIEEDSMNLSPILAECLKRLKEQQRLSIELFYYKKMCYKEIATQLTLSEKQIKTDIQNGKRNLKICIEESSKS
ncbi:MAG: sigma-70 family RNA polymerase sigma factor [Bacteroidales bacterium]|nr:sigma-70 family RNA polymerase sigma factor [Bacteroidales bacterium]